MNNDCFEDCDKSLKEASTVVQNGLMLDCSLTQMNSDCSEDCDKSLKGASTVAKNGLMLGCLLTQMNNDCSEETSTVVRVVSCLVACLLKLITIAL